MHVTKTKTKTVDPNALELVEIDGAMWHRITDANGVDCLYPTEGAGSVADIIDRFGDDLDVVLQSATRYVEAPEADSDSSIAPEIEVVHGHPWANVKTVDGRHAISVSIGRLLYDGDKCPYLLTFVGEEERRLYI